MRYAALLLLAGCRLFGLEDPILVNNDAAATADAGARGDSTDAPCIDDDQDGVCNALDTWPCGAAPSTPSATVSVLRNGSQTRLDLTTIAVGGSQMATVQPGSSVLVTFNYTFTDTSCGAANCVDQIEVGLAPGNRVGCAYDAAVSRTSGASGGGSQGFPAPTTPGVYDVRVNIGQNYGCTYQGATMWWPPNPPASDTIARLCVH